MRFKVGDVVVVTRVNHNVNAHMVGATGTVTRVAGSSAGPRYFLDIHPALGEPPIGTRWGGFRPDQLKPKRPPLGPWQDIQAMVGWNPTKVKERA